jgi:hypothetical protein
MRNTKTGREEIIKPSNSATDPPVPTGLVGAGAEEDNQKANVKINQ